MSFNERSPIQHFLNEPQANLGLPDPPHSMQKEVLPPLNLVSDIGRKVLLQFGNHVCPACEQITRVWHERDNAVKCPVEKIVVDDLREVHGISVAL